jgi:lipid-A-disaccharide synthase-like uncharacterized protein
MWAIFALGFIGQAFFFSRTLIQWLMSEHSKKVVSPTIFWILSLIGSCIFFFYGWLRSDFSIILGQSITYFIYIWNLYIKGVWGKIPVLFRVLLYALPVVVLIYLIEDAGPFFRSFLNNKDIPLWLVILGSVGQVTFTLRFVYQWYYSYRKKLSLLPAGFWYFSLVGSSIILIYAIIRRDPVLILSQAFGFVVYVRNIMIGLRERFSNKTVK